MGLDLETKTSNEFKKLPISAILDMTFLLMSRGLLIGGVIWGIYNLFDFTLFEAFTIGLSGSFVFKAFDIDRTLKQELVLIQRKIEGMMLFYEGEEEENLGDALQEHFERLLLQHKKADAVRLYRNISQCDMKTARQFINELEEKMIVEKSVK